MEACFPIEQRKKSTFEKKKNLFIYMLLVTEQFFFFVPDDIISVLKGFQTVISGTILGWGANNEKKKTRITIYLRKG